MEETIPPTAADRALRAAAIKGQQVEALCEIAQLVGAAADLDTALPRILRVLHDTLDMKRATLYLLNDSGGQLVIAASYGLSAAEARRGVYGLDEGVCGKVFRSRYPFVVPDVNSEPLFLNRTRSRDIEKDRISFIGVPVILRNEPVGVLTVDRIFSSEVSFEEDVYFITVVATLIAQFLELDRVLKEKEQALVAENRSLRAELDRRCSRHNIIGQSKVMHEVFRLIDRVAPSRATALLLGESGTGKELVARAIHQAGPRARQPFVKVNCAALPGNLLESELLGHEKGAFTGATSFKKGKFELAHGGTLFLDEIGELPLNLQAKLLRVLQERQFERLGGTRTIEVDVRIIAATNVVLERAVDAGAFRADLYYRLNVFPILLPPLRERREDIPLLTDFFLRDSNRRNGRAVRFSSEIIEFFSHYDWPGNVRELQNIVERLVIMATGDQARVGDLPSFLVAEPESAATAAPVPEPGPAVTASSVAGPSLPTPSASLADMERQVIESSLLRNGWIQARTARELGLTQRQIGYKIKKYGLKPPPHLQR